MGKRNRMWNNIKLSWKKLLYIIVCQMSMSSTDFLTDILTGLELFQIVIIFLDTNGTSEVHLIWGSLTFFFMFLPGLMVAMHMLSSLYHENKEMKMLKEEEVIESEESFPMLPSSDTMIQIDPMDAPRLHSTLEWSESTTERIERQKMFLLFFRDNRLVTLLCIFVFPIGFLFTQSCYIYSIFTGNDRAIKQLDFITTRLRGFEAFFESAPQLMLQIFRVAYTETWTEIQIASMVFSLLTLGSTAIFCDMLFSKLKDIKTQIFHLLGVFPLYLTSVVFNLGSLAFAIVFLRFFAFIPCAVSFGLKSLAAYDLNFSLMDSIEMAFSNMAVLYVGPFKPRGQAKDESRFQFMMRSTLISFLVFDATLIFLMVLFNRDPNYFEFWKSIVLDPANNELVGLYMINVIIAVLLLMSVFNVCLYISAVYSKLTKTGPQILSEVSEIVRRIDQLDNPELSSEDVFQEMNCFSELLKRDYISKFKVTDVMTQMESILKNEKCSNFISKDVISLMDTLSQLLKSNKCKELKAKEVIAHINTILW